MTTPDLTRIDTSVGGSQAPEQQRYVVKWRAGEPNQPAMVGGFLRCVGQSEVDDFIAQLDERGASSYVEEDA